MSKTSLISKIARKAKKIRRPGETWHSALKRASKKVPSLSPSSKKRRGSVGVSKKRSSSRQTGTSNTSIDKRVKAKAPGKRAVKTAGGKKHFYYERRKNRSDKPGKMTGVDSGNSTYRYNVLQRVNSSVRHLNEAEKKLLALQNLLKAVPRSDKADKRKIRGYIEDQKKYIKQLKADVRGFKSLIK